jgi:hypothetical protein
VDPSGGAGLQDAQCVGDGNGGWQVDEEVNVIRDAADRDESALQQGRKKKSRRGSFGVAQPPD